MEEITIAEMLKRLNIKFDDIEKLGNLSIALTKSNYPDIAKDIDEMIELQKKLKKLSDE